MRLMAHYSRDPNMIDVICKGWDIHCGTAALMFDRSYDEVTAAVKKKKQAAHDPAIKLTDDEKQLCFYRQIAKTIGFGLNYGEGPQKLGHQLGVNTDQAKLYIANYFQPYPHVQQFIVGVHKFIADEARVETVLGRLRRFPEMLTLGNMPRREMRGMARQNLARQERQSVNSVIQGSAADVAKAAMLVCEGDMRLHRLGAKMLLQIHDELIFECPQDTADQALGIIKHNMEHPLTEELLVPLDVDIGIGRTWVEAKG
jgi:DNA polymerase-1